MKTILVVGLIRDQKTHVERECAGLNVKLRFLEAKPKARLRGDCDHCILMVKWVSHGHTRDALASYPRSQVHFSRGGVHEVLQTIRGIAEGTVTRGVRHP